MDSVEHLRLARDAFRAELAETPALSLRGANAVDGYDHPEPFDAALDEPTDEYLERFAFWGMPYLDARSWRHYLPRLIEYASSHPDDPAMVVEATVRSLRPPDRVPARLTTLSAEQEAAVMRFLERVALSDDENGSRDDARSALEEWWLSDAPLRARALAQPAAHRPSEYRVAGGGAYRITLPTTMEGGGVHHVPEEHRAIEVWRGTVCGDALADVFVSASPVTRRSWRDAEASVSGWMTPESRAWIDVPGAKKALRLDGTTYRYSPAEPDRTTVVIALAGDEIVTLTIRATERADVQAEMDRSLRSFELTHDQDRPR
ncbi:MAG TPA: DUF6714 family protein [Gemmatimonadaceae bacterium]|nr:DUF6714 family protein [Gemmatimonadaceae bacterium]